MSTLIEIPGPLVKRFIWSELRYRTGRWINLVSTCGKANVRFWEEEK